MLHGVWHLQVLSRQLTEQKVICIYQGVDQHRFHSPGDPVLISPFVQIIPSVEQFIYIPRLLLMIPDLSRSIYRGHDSCETHKAMRIKGSRDTEMQTISCKVVKFVNVDAVPVIRYYFAGILCLFHDFPDPIFWSIFGRSNINSLIKWMSFRPAQIFKFPPQSFVWLQHVVKQSGACVFVRPVKSFLSSQRFDKPSIICVREGAMSQIVAKTSNFDTQLIHLCNCNVTIMIGLDATGKRQQDSWHLCSGQSGGATRLKDKIAGPNLQQVS